MKPQIVINGRMQQGYIYSRTKPVGRSFAPEFEPQLTPKQMLALGVFGGKYMTDCRDEFPATWFAHARLCAERARFAPELLRRQRVAIAGRVATERLDQTGRIRADGFSGTAGTTSGAGRATTRDRSDGGAPLRGTSRPFGSIVTRETSTAAAAAPGSAALGV